MTHLVENNFANDASWLISILVTDLNIQRNLYVTGSLHIGGLMLRLVDEVGLSYILLINSSFQVTENVPISSGNFLGCFFCISLQPLSGSDLEFV